MKKLYLKPNAEYIKLDVDDHIMDQYIDGSMGVGDSDEEDF